MQIQLTSEITWPYSTTSVISGLFYTSYSPVVSQDAAILAQISGSQLLSNTQKIIRSRRGIWADIPRNAYQWGIQDLQKGGAENQFQ